MSGGLLAARSCGPPLRDGAAPARDEQPGRRHRLACLAAACIAAAIYYSALKQRRRGPSPPAAHVTRRPGARSARDRKSARAPSPRLRCFRHGLRRLPLVHLPMSAPARRAAGRRYGARLSLRVATAHHARIMITQRPERDAIEPTPTGWHAVPSRSSKSSPSLLPLCKPRGRLLMQRSATQACRYENQVGCGIRGGFCMP